MPMYDFIKIISNPRNLYIQNMTFVDDFACPSGCFLGWLMKLVSMILILFKKKDAVEKLGLSVIQKCAAAVQILGYGMTPDSLD